MKTASKWIVAALVLAISGAILAQEPAAPQPQTPRGPALGPKQSDEDIDALVESVMAARLAKELGLDDEKTVVLVRRLAELRDQTKALRQERQKMARDLKTALNEEAGDESIQQKLDALLEHDQKMAELKRNALTEAGADLSVAQRARLYVFISDFEADMRRLIQRARERRSGPGGPMAGPGGNMQRPFRRPNQGAGPAGRQRRNDSDEPPGNPEDAPPPSEPQQ